MRTRPFDIDFVRSRVPNETEFQCVFESADSVDIENYMNSVNVLKILFSSLERLGQHGGFCGNSFNPLESALNLERPRFSNGLFSCSIKHLFLDPGIVIVICNLMHSLALNGIRVRSLKFATQLIDDNGPDVVELPGVFRSLPFELLLEIKSPTVVVDVEFRRRQEARKLEYIRTVFDSWYEVAAHGGFADLDLHQPTGEATLFVENELQITSVGMQIVYERVATSESAFFSIANFLGKFHYKAAEIQSVAIT
jgi:hypothetical protein